MKLTRHKLLAVCLVAACTATADEAAQRAAAQAFLKPLGPLPADKYAIALLKDDSLPNHDPKLADEFADLLRKGGHEVTLINADQLCNPFLITTARFDMLFLPACHTLPGEAGPVIKAYCDKGGDLAALGTPAFRNTLARVARVSDADSEIRPGGAGYKGGKWLTKDDWRKLLAAQPTARVIFSFDAEDLSKWQRHTNAPNSPITRELVPGKEGQALHVVMPNMTGWDGLASPKLDRPFPPGHTLTCLWAKAGAPTVGGVSTRRDAGWGHPAHNGDVPPTMKDKTRDEDIPPTSTAAPPTDKLMLEWREKDGSRWIAVFRVGAEWQRIVLVPSDFKFWQSVPTRGGPGDGFKPENAEQLVIGVAHTHTGPRTGRYEFLIDQLGTAPAPPGLADLEGKFLPPPILENFSPSYKFYDLDLGAVWVLAGPDGRIQVPQQLRAHCDRPAGRGMIECRSWRWCPLLVAFSKRSEYRGAPASLYLDFSTRSTRLAVCVDDPEWLRHHDVRPILSGMVTHMARGVFFQEAGTQCFTYAPRAQVQLGARVVNTSRQRVPGLKVEYHVIPLDPGDGEASEWATVRTSVFALEAGTPALFRDTIPWPKSGRKFAVITSLLCKDEEVGRGVKTFISAVQWKPVGQRRFVTAHDGDFWLDGKRWYPHGVNYMPSTGIGVEDNEYFEYWLDAKPYDPEFVQCDLRRIKDIGFNSVSIFVYHRSLPANNLLDFLRRCDELGLKVNLSLRPGTPMDYKWEEWREIIEKNRLWEQDVIWAYDIAWEPFFGTEAERKRYDPLWREWVIKKHGSPEAAEKAWGMKPVGGPSPAREERTRGRDAPPTEITSPTGWQLTNDGEHRKFVADYRRFADELVHERYLDAYKKIKAIDPSHLISFRMTVTGDPTFNDPGNMPYDFRGVAKAMDFLAPEGYGRIGDWERVKAGLFTVAYARACAPDKPVFWAEAGVSAWDDDAMAATPEKLDFQARFYRDFYRMMLASHSNGVAWWWYPGGYRVNERSDYGIINPDGTDRPVTKVIREFGPKLTAERVIPKPNVWIEVDRDSDARGLFGVYEKVKGEFWRAVEGGKVVGLRRVMRDP